MRTMRRRARAASGCSIALLASAMPAVAELVIVDEAQLFAPDINTPANEFDAT